MRGAWIRLCTKSDSPVSESCHSHGTAALAGDSRGGRRRLAGDPQPGRAGLI
jgi:hypothetical protein